MSTLSGAQGGLGYMPASHCDDCYGCWISYAGCCPHALSPILSCSFSILPFCHVQFLV